MVDGADRENRTLFVLSYRGVDRADSVDFPQPGDRLAFCGEVLWDTYWWPQTGHQKGWFGKRIFGAPQGPYPAVKWHMDLPADN